MASSSSPRGAPRQAVGSVGSVAGSRFSRRVRCRFRGSGRPRPRSGCLGRAPTFGCSARTASGSGASATASGVAGASACPRPRLRPSSVSMLSAGVRTPPGPAPRRNRMPVRLRLGLDRVLDVPRLPVASVRDSSHRGRLCGSATSGAVLSVTVTAGGPGVSRPLRLGAVRRGVAEVAGQEVRQPSTVQKVRARASHPRPAGGRGQGCFT